MAAAQRGVLTEAAILLAAAVVAVPLFRKLRLGSVLGYLAAGIVIGPAGLGFFNDPESIMHVAELGVVLLLFLIGLELDPARLWAMRRDIFGLGAAQVLVSGGLAMLFPLLVVGRPWRASLIAGLGLALSSTALVMQLLEERGELQAPHGRKAFSILLFQDLAVVPLLALAALLSPTQRTGGPPVWLAALAMVAAVAGLILCGRYLLNPMLRVLANTGARESMTAAALLTVIAAAGAMTSVGLSSALGAFIAGIMLSGSSYRHELEADVEPFRGLLLGLFFVSVGMSVDLAIIAHSWRVLLLALLTLTVIKVAVVYALVRWTGEGHGAAMRTALLLSQGGEFAFVLFATAVAARVMTREHASLLVALVTLSMAVTPLLVVLTPLLAREKARGRDESFENANGEVIVIGFGRFGQVVSQMLLVQGVTVTAIDNDIEMIEAAERFGFRVYYGDGARLDVLRAAGADRARLICICVDNKHAATHILEHARGSFPLARVLVRSYDRVHALEVLERGAHYQVRETYESAIVLGRLALEGLELSPERVAEVEDDVRTRDRERFALEQQGGVEAGRQRLLTRPVPRPEPLVPPRGPGVPLNPEEIVEAGVRDSLELS